MIRHPMAAKMKAFSVPNIITRVSQAVASCFPACYDPTRSDRLTLAPTFLSALRRASKSPLPVSPCINVIWYAIESITRPVTVHFRTDPDAAQCDSNPVSTDRRSTPRFKLHTSLSFNRRMSLSDSEQTRALNISTTGVCFGTRLALSVGEVVEVLLEMPKRVTGTMAVPRRFTGRITHVDSQTNLPGYSYIGVQLLYCSNLAAHMKGGSTAQRRATKS
jgi:hypothetical protein